MTMYRIYFKSPTGITATVLESDTAPQFDTISIGSFAEPVLNVGDVQFKAEHVVGWAPNVAHKSGV